MRCSAFYLFNETKIEADSLAQNLNKTDLCSRIVYNLRQKLYSEKKLLLVSFLRLS